MERVKILAGNEIELGMNISTIESRASNIPTDKENYVCCHNSSTDKIFVEYVGTNMGIQVPLFVIDRRGVSVATSRACVGFSLEEERVMQQSRGKYFPQLRTKVSIQ